MILATRFTLLLKEVEKTCLLTQNWLNHVLIMSYLVTICFILLEKTQKNLIGRWHTPPPPPTPTSLLNVRGLNLLLFRPSRRLPLPLVYVFYAQNKTRLLRDTILIIPTTRYSHRQTITRVHNSVKYELL